MKIEKAIEILEDYQAGVEMEELREYPDVIQLCIGALKRLNHDRIWTPIKPQALLPGETEA